MRRRRDVRYGRQTSQSRYARANLLCAIWSLIENASIGGLNKGSLALELTPNIDIDNLCIADKNNVKSIAEKIKRQRNFVDRKCLDDTIKEAGGKGIIKQLVKDALESDTSPAHIYHAVKYGLVRGLALDEEGITLLAKVHQWWEQIDKTVDQWNSKQSTVDLDVITNDLVKMIAEGLPGSSGEKLSLPTAEKPSADFRPRRLKAGREVVGNSCGVPPLDSDPCSDIALRPYAIAACLSALSGQDGGWDHEHERSADNGFSSLMSNLANYFDKQAGEQPPDYPKSLDSLLSPFSSSSRIFHDGRETKGNVSDGDVRKVISWLFPDEHQRSELETGWKALGNDVCKAGALRILDALVISFYLPDDVIKSYLKAFSVNSGVGDNPWEDIFGEMLETLSAWATEEKHALLLSSEGEPPALATKAFSTGEDTKVIHGRDEIVNVIVEKLLPVKGHGKASVVLSGEPGMGRRTVAREVTSKLCESGVKMLDGRPAFNRAKVYEVEFRDNPKDTLDTLRFRVNGEEISGLDETVIALMLTRLPMDALVILESVDVPWEGLMGDGGSTHHDSGGISQSDAWTDLCNVGKASLIITTSLGTVLSNTVGQARCGGGSASTVNEHEIVELDPVPLFHVIEDDAKANEGLTDWLTRVKEEERDKSVRMMYGGIIEARKEKRDITEVEASFLFNKLRDVFQGSLEDSGITGTRVLNTGDVLRFFANQKEIEGDHLAGRDANDDSRSSVPAKFRPALMRLSLIPSGTSRDFLIDSGFLQDVAPEAKGSKKDSLTELLKHLESLHWISLYPDGNDQRVSMRGDLRRGLLKECGGDSPVGGSGGYLSLAKRMNDVLEGKLKSLYSAGANQGGVEPRALFVANCCSFIGLAKNLLGLLCKQDGEADTSGDLRISLYRMIADRQSDLSFTQAECDSRKKLADLYRNAVEMSSWAEQEIRVASLEGKVAKTDDDYAEAIRRCTTILDKREVQEDGEMRARALMQRGYLEHDLWGLHGLDSARPWLPDPCAKRGEELIGAAIRDKAEALEVLLGELKKLLGEEGARCIVDGPVGPDISPKEHTERFWKGFWSIINSDSSDGRRREDEEAASILKTLKTLASILKTLAYSEFYGGDRELAVAHGELAITLFKSLLSRPGDEAPLRDAKDGSCSFSIKSEEDRGLAIELAATVNSQGYFLSPPDDDGSERWRREVRTRLDGALELKKEALELRKKLLQSSSEGFEHMDIARSRNNISLTLKALGDLDGALAEARRAETARDGRRSHKTGESGHTLIDWNLRDIEEKMDKREGFWQLLEAQLYGFQGTCSVFASDMRGHDVSFRFHQEGERPDPMIDTLGIEEKPDDLYESGSTIKVFIDVVLQILIEEGKLGENQTVRYLSSDYVGGSGVLRATPDPENTVVEYRLRDLAELMIAVSDNVATNMVIRAIGGVASAEGGTDDKRDCYERGRGEINKMIKELGFAKTRLVAKKVEFPKEAHNSLGTTTAKEYAGILVQIYRGELYYGGKRRGDTAKKVLGHLGKQRSSRILADGIRPYLTCSSSGPVKVYSKSGTMDDVRSDGGIVVWGRPRGDDPEAGPEDERPRVEYVAALMCKGFKDTMESDEHPGVVCLRRVSSFLFDYFATLSLA